MLNNKMDTKQYDETHQRQRQGRRMDGYDIT